MSAPSLTARYDAIREMRHAFQADSVARAYAMRPPYPAEVHDRLAGLIAAGAPRLLDAGCGPGKLARGLAAHLPGADRLERIDAVDPSEAMLAAGRGEPGGSDPRIRWIQASIETATLGGPYGLAVAGASVHWFDLDGALPRIADALAPGAFLALVDGDGAWQPPWIEAELELLMELAERRTGQRPALSPRDEPLPPIVAHPCFEPVGRLVTSPATFEQPIHHYIECQHSRASLSRETLGEELSRVLRDGLHRILAPHAVGGQLRFSTRFQLEWGRLTSGRSV